MSWECSGCMMENAEENDVCEVCGDPRMDEVEEQDVWECPTCCVDIPSAEAACGMCGGARPQDEPEARPPAPDSPRETGGVMRKASDETVPQGASPPPEPGSPVESPTPRRLSRTPSPTPSSPAPTAGQSFNRAGSLMSNVSFVSRMDDPTYMKMRDDLSQAKSDARALERAKNDEIKELTNRVKQLEVNEKQLADSMAEQAKEAMSTQGAEKKLKREVEQKEKKIATLKEDLDKLDETYRKHLRETSAELANVEKIKGAAKAAEDKAIAAEARAGELQQKASAADATASELSAKVKILEDAAAGHTTALQAAEAATAAAQAKLADAEQALVDVEAQHAREVEQLKADAGAATAASASIKDLEARLAASEEEAELLKASVEEAASRHAREMEDLKGELSTAGAAATKASGALEDEVKRLGEALAAASKTHEDATVQLKADLDAAATKVKDLEAALKKKEKEEKKAKEALEKAEKAEEEASSKVKKLKKKLAKSEEEAEKFKSEKESVEAVHAKELDQMREEMMAAIDGAAADVKALEEKLAASTLEVDSLKQALADSNARHAQAEASKSDAAGAEIAALRARLEESEQHGKILEEKVAASAAEIDNMKQTIADSDAQHAQAEASKSDAAHAEVAALQAKLKESGQHATTLQAAVDAAEKRCMDALARADADAMQVSTAGSEAKALQEKLDGSVQRQRTLDASLEEAQAKLDAETAKATAAAADLQALQVKLEDSEARGGTLATSLAAAEARLAAAMDASTGTATETSALHEQLTASTARVDELTKALEEAETRHTRVLEQLRNEKEAELAALKAAGGASTDVTAQAAAHAKAMADLEARCTKAMEELEARCEEVSEKLVAERKAHTAEVYALKEALAVLQNVSVERTREKSSREKLEADNATLTVSLRTAQRGEEAAMDAMKAQKEEVQKLTAILEEVRAVESGDAAAVAVATRHQDELAQLRVQHAEEIAALEASRDELENSFSAAQRGEENAVDAMAAKIDEVEQLARVLDEIRLVSSGGAEAAAEIAAQHVEELARLKSQHIESDAARTKEIASLRELLAAKVDEIAAHREQAEALQAQLEDARNTGVAAHVAAAAGELQAEAASLAEDVQQLRADLRVSNIELAAAKEREAEVAAALETANKAQSVEQALHADLQAEVDRARAAEAAAASALSGVQQEMEALRGAVADHETALTAARDAKQAADVAVRDLRSELEAARVAEARADGRVTAMQQQVDALQDATAPTSMDYEVELRNRNVQLEGELAAAVREVEDLKRRDAGGEGAPTPPTHSDVDVKALQEELAAVKAELAAVQAGEAAAQRSAAATRSREAALAGTMMAAASPETLDALRRSLEEKSKELTEALLRETKLRQEVHAACPRDVDAVMEMKEEVTRLRKEAAEADEHEAFLKEKVAKLEGRVGVLTEDLALARARPVSPPPSPPPAAAAEPDAENVAAVREQLEAAEARVHELEAVNEKGASEREKKYRTELRELKKELITARASARASSQPPASPPPPPAADTAALEAQQAELTALRAQLAASHGVLASSQEQLAGNQEQLAAAAEREAALQARLDAAEQAAAAAEFEHAQAASPVDITPPESPAVPQLAAAKDEIETLQQELQDARNRESALEAELDALRAVGALSPPPTQAAGQRYVDPLELGLGTPDAPGEDVVRSLQEQLTETQSREQAVARQLASAQERIEQLEKDVATIATPRKEQAEEEEATATPTPAATDAGDEATVVALRAQLEHAEARVSELTEELEGKDPADWTPVPGEKGKDFYLTRERKFKKEIRDLKKELLSAKSGQRKAAAAAGRSSPVPSTAGNSPSTTALGVSVSGMSMVSTNLSPPSSPSSAVGHHYPGGAAAPATLEDAMKKIEELEERNHALKKEVKEAKFAAMNERIAGESRSRSAERNAGGGGRLASLVPAGDVVEKLQAAEEANKALKRDNRAIKTELLKLKNAARKKAAEERSASPEGVDMDSPARDLLARDADGRTLAARYKSITDLENKLRLVENKCVVVEAKLGTAQLREMELERERDELLDRCKAVLTAPRPATPPPEIDELQERLTASEKRSAKLGEALRHADTSAAAQLQRVKDLECRLVLVEGELTVWRRKGSASRDDELQAYKAKYLTALDRSKFLDGAVKKLQDELAKQRARLAEATDTHAHQATSMAKEIWSLKNEVRTHEGLPQLPLPHFPEVVAEDLKGEDEKEEASPPQAPPARSASPVQTIIGGMTALDTSSPQLLEAERKKVQRLQAELRRLQSVEHTDTTCLDTILRKGVVEVPKLIPTSPHHRGSLAGPGLSPRSWSKLRKSTNILRDPSPRSDIYGTGDGDSTPRVPRLRTPRR